MLLKLCLKDSSLPNGRKVLELSPETTIGQLLTEVRTLIADINIDVLYGYPVVNLTSTSKDTELQHVPIRSGEILRVQRKAIPAPAKGKRKAAPSSEDMARFGAMDPELHAFHDAAQASAFSDEEYRTSDSDEIHPKKKKKAKKAPMVSNKQRSSSSTGGGTVRGLFDKPSGTSGGKTASMSKKHKWGPAANASSSCGAAAPKTAAETAANATKVRRSRQTASSEQDISFHLVSAVTSGTTSRDKGLRRVFSSALAHQYESSQSVSRVAAVDANSFTVTRIDEPPNTSMNTSPKLKKVSISYPNHTVRRGSPYVEEIEVIEPPLLNAVLARAIDSVGDDEPASADAREVGGHLHDVLQIMNLARVSPRMFWSIVLFSPSDVLIQATADSRMKFLQKLQTLIPHVHDWSWFGERKRELSSKARENASQLQKKSNQTNVHAVKVTEVENINSECASNIDLQAKDPSTDLVYARLPIFKRHLLNLLKGITLEAAMFSYDRDSDHAFFDEERMKATRKCLPMGVDGDLLWLAQTPDELYIPNDDDDDEEVEKQRATAGQNHGQVVLDTLLAAGFTDDVAEKIQLAAQNELYWQAWSATIGCSARLDRLLRSLHLHTLSRIAAFASTPSLLLELLLKREPELGYEPLPLLVWTAEHDSGKLMYEWQAHLTVHAVTHMTCLAQAFVDICEWGSDYDVPKSPLSQDTAWIQQSRTELHDEESVEKMMCIIHPLYSSALRLHKQFSKRNESADLLREVVIDIDQRCGDNSLPSAVAWLRYGTALVAAEEEWHTNFHKRLQSSCDSRAEAEAMSIENNGSVFIRHQAALRAAWEALEGSRRTFHFHLQSLAGMPEKHEAVLNLYLAMTQIQLTSLRNLRGDSSADTLGEAQSAHALLLKASPWAPVPPVRLQSLVILVHLSMAAVHRSPIGTGPAEDDKSHILLAQQAYHYAKSGSEALVAAYAHEHRQSPSNKKFFEQPLNDMRVACSDITTALQQLPVQTLSSANPGSQTAPTITLDLSPSAKYTPQAELGEMIEMSDPCSSFPEPPLAEITCENWGLESDDPLLSQWSLKGPNMNSYVIVRNAEENSGLWDLAVVVAYLPPEDDSNEEVEEEEALWKVCYHTRCESEPQTSDRARIHTPHDSVSWEFIDLDNVEISKGLAEVPPSIPKKQQVLTLK